MNYDYYSFNPKVIKWQWQAMKKIYKCQDNLVMALLDGTLGSAKSALCAWLILDHCVEFSDAVAVYGRRSERDLKKSAFLELQNLVTKTWGEKANSWINLSTLSFKFPWGARIESATWGDRKWDKFKSQNYSAGWIEEGTENSSEDWIELSASFLPRIGRINKNNSGVKRNILLISTNPESPDHYLYKTFIDGETGLRFRSHMRDNPFLPDDYYNRLKATMTKKMFERNADGEWNYASAGDSIYYAFSDDNIVAPRLIDKSKPLMVSFDFNASDGKPMSCSIAQKIGKEYFVISEIIIPDGKTIHVLKEIESRGYLDCMLYIYGDASGVHKDTRSFGNDFTIIQEFLRSKKAKFEMRVLKSNPLVKARHNSVNTMFENANNHRRLFICSNCIVTIKGLRLTRFKKGTEIEDDNNEYQHITTALGYMIYYETILESYN